MLGGKPLPVIVIVSPVANVVGLALQDLIPGPGGGGPGGGGPPPADGWTSIRLPESEVVHVAVTKFVLMFSKSIA